MAVVDVGLHCLLRLPQASAPEELPAIGAASAQLHRLGTQEALGLGPHLCLRVDISSFSDQGGCSLPSTLGFCFVLFCVVETGSHVTQAGLQLTVLHRMTMSFKSSCFYLLGASITRMCFED